MTRSTVVTRFVTSSYSAGGSGNECLEVAHTSDGGRVIRDSKHRQGSVQRCSPAAWAAFLSALKSDALR
jgi:hypothetical protein